MGQSKGRSGIWVATQLANTLKTNLPATIVLVNADHGDNISIPEPHTDSYSVGELEKYPEQFPILFFLPKRSDLHENRGEVRYEIEKWDITIAFIHSGEGKEIDVLTELDRLVQAVQETILANNLLGDSSGIIYDAFPYSKAYGTLLTDGVALLQEAQLGIRVAVCNS